MQVATDVVAAITQAIFVACAFRIQQDACRATGGSCQHDATSSQSILYSIFLVDVGDTGGLAFGVRGDFTHHAVGIEVYLASPERGINQHGAG